VPDPDRPIGPYEREPAAIHAWDPRVVDVAQAVGMLIRERRPDLEVEHVGSSAVPGLPGRNVVDLAMQADPADIPAITERLLELGFQPQPGPDVFPPTRPLLVGSMAARGERFRIHLHVYPTGPSPWAGDFARDVAFRDALRADADLRGQYAAVKRGIVAASEGPLDSQVYAYAKASWISTAYARLGLLRRPIEPPATIGILGGGQLGRMLGFAARSMGYRIAVLDPDPECPAAAIADRVVVAPYDSVEGALELAEGCDVVTYELEHVDAAVVDAVDAIRPVRPGPYPLRVTQDRLAERRFVEGHGVAVAPWYEVRDVDGLAAAAAGLGHPGVALRLKASIGGYDGRSQVRILSASEPGGAAAAERSLREALQRLGRPVGEAALLEIELGFRMELSVIVARALDGTMAAFPVARNVHDAGILVESVAPAPVDPDVVRRATKIGETLAVGMGLVGLLTVELFLLPDGSLVVNELAPRVHNSGHWTVEACRVSQFEQHVRAVCGLPLGDPGQDEAVALVNLLGEGPRRPAALTGLADALADPRVRVHVYDKREVFERRKMGHVVALADSLADPDVAQGVETALERARRARSALRWS
jgi:5-(carboxyamino)imidazole ribonucleotide synthase